VIQDVPLLKSKDELCKILDKYTKIDKEVAETIGASLEKCQNVTVKNVMLAGQTSSMKYAGKVSSEGFLECYSGLILKHKY